MNETLLEPLEVLDPEEVYARVLAVPTNTPVVEAGDAYRRLVLGHPEFWPIFDKYRLPGEGRQEVLF